MCLNLISLRENLTEAQALELQRELQKAGIYSIVTVCDFRQPECLRKVMILREDRLLAQAVLDEDEKSVV